MRKIVSILLILTLLSGVHMTSIAADTTMVNDSFSEKLSDWTTVNADYTIENNGYESCAKVVMNAAYGRAMYKFKFERNVKYLVSVKVRLDEGRNTANLIIDHRSFGDKSLILSAVKNVVVSNEWAKLTGEYVWNGEGTGEAQIYVRVGGALEPLTYYMDDFLIQKRSDSKDNYDLTQINESELVSNFGFENGTEGYVVEGAEINTVIGGVNNTASGARIQSKSGSAFVGQKLVAEPDTKYKISAYIKAESGSIKADTAIIFPDNDMVVETGYIRDYTQQSSSERAYLSVGKGEAFDKWTKIEGEYIHRGAAKELIFGIAPHIENGNTFLIDEISVLKAGNIQSVDYDTQALSGVTVDGVYKGSPSWLTVKNGYAVADVKDLASLLGAEYSNGVLTKGFDKLVLDVENKTASLNGKLLPVRELYELNGSVYADVQTVSRAVKADASVISGAVSITTKKESNAFSNFADSLINSKKASVAFLGGGAAYGRGAGWINETSYRKLIMKWLNNKFNDCTIEELNYTHWYSDSELAVYKINELIACKPQVVLIDFAAEDSEREYEDIVYNLESIVSKIKANSSATDIVLIAGYTETSSDSYSNGNVPTVFEAYDYIAQKYSLPLIDIGLKLNDEIIKNKKTQKDYMRYLWFPNDSGHSFYADAVIDFMDSALNTPSKPTFKNNAVHSVTTDGCFVGVDKAEICTFDNSAGYLSGNIGDSLEFKFSGNSVGVMWETGIDTGAVDVEIDGVYKGTFYAFDRFGVRAAKPYYSIFERNLAAGEHTLKITVSDKKSEMSLGNRIKIIGFLVGNTINK